MARLASIVLTGASRMNLCVLPLHYQGCMSVKIEKIMYMVEITSFRRNAHTTRIFLNSYLFIASDNKYW